jgi:hypothetical protein
MSPDQFSSVVFEGLRFAVMRWVDSCTQGREAVTATAWPVGDAMKVNAWFTFTGVITRVAAPFKQRVGDVRVGGVDPWSGLRAVVDLTPQEEHTMAAATYLHAWLDTRDSAGLWEAFTASESRAFKFNGLWPVWLPVEDAESPQSPVPRVRGRVSP